MVVLQTKKVQYPFRVGSKRRSSSIIVRITDIFLAVIVPSFGVSRSTMEKCCMLNDSRVESIHSLFVLRFHNI